MTADRWADLEDLFGPERGANSGCWCMAVRVSRAAHEAMGKSGRKDAFRSIAEAGPPPGLLAYDGERAVGWCAVGPRSSFARFQRSRLSAFPHAQSTLDPLRIHAITCFYVRSGYRRQGLTARLAKAAIEFARKNGAMAVDACAIDPEKPLVWGDGFVGITSVYIALGFREIARRSPRRPLMRLILRSTP